MKIYAFHDINNLKLGTLTVEDEHITPDFADPGWQYHFLEQIEMHQPKTISELLRSGYAYYSAIEEV